jgi:hypothetical protein
LGSRSFGWLRRLRRRLLMIRGSIAVATEIRPGSGAAATMIVNGLTRSRSPGRAGSWAAPSLFRLRRRRRVRTGRFGSVAGPTTRAVACSRHHPARDMETAAKSHAGTASMLRTSIQETLLHACANITSFKPRISLTEAKAMLPAKYPDYLWGDFEIDVYRACMAQHGQ